MKTMKSGNAVLQASGDDVWIEDLVTGSDEWGYYLIEPHPEADWRYRLDLMNGSVFMDTPRFSLWIL